MSYKILDMIESMDNDNKGKSPKSNSNSSTPVLDNFSRDLIKLAEQGKLDPVVGREQEITRIAQILSRRKKNHPILIGVIIVILLLSIPLIAMQFTDSVIWSMADFILAGIIIFSVTQLILVVLKTAKYPKIKVILVTLIITILFLTWIELAVGIFGTPIAGN